MQKLYKLNDGQVLTLTENIRYTSAREKAMSILAYITRLIEHNGGAIMKTYKDLHRMHQKSSKRPRVSFQRFKAIMKQLLDLKLIFTDNEVRNSVHKYSLTEIQAEKQAKIQANENSTESTENTSIEGDDVANSDYANLNNIYNNTRQKDTISKCEAKEITMSLFDMFNIKDKNVKKAVLDRVGKVYCLINRSGANAYIAKIIQNTQLWYKELYKQIKFTVTKSQNMNSHKINKKSNNKIKLFREKNYDYNALELELLGWNED